MIRNFYIIAILLASSSVNLASASGIICWDRNINAVSTAFGHTDSPIKAAKNFYPPYVKITDKSVQWGLSANSWYKPEKNTGESYVRAEVFRFNSTLLKFRYNNGTEKLKVLGVAPGKVTPLPVTYSKCKKIGSEVNKKLRNTYQNVKKNVQQQLNRLGCSVGTADGAIGPASKRGLDEFAVANNSFSYDISVFSDKTFLALLVNKPTGFCQK